MAPTARSAFKVTAETMKQWCTGKSNYHFFGVNDEGTHFVVDMLIEDLKTGAKQWVRENVAIESSATIGERVAERKKAPTKRLRRSAKAAAAAAAAAAADGGRGRARGRWWVREGCQYVILNVDRSAPEHAAHSTGSVGGGGQRGTGGHGGPKGRFRTRRRSWYHCMVPGWERG